MKHYDEKEWYETAPGEVREAVQAELKAISTEEMQLWIDGPEKKLAAIGKEIRIRLQPGTHFFFVGEGQIFTTTAGKKVAVRSYGKVLTNMDRLPTESGSYAEVQRAGRLAQLRIRDQMMSVREETRKLKEARMTEEEMAELAELRRLRVEQQEDEQEVRQDGEGETSAA